MNKEQLKEKKEEISLINNYNKNLRILSELCFPIPNIVEIFVFDKEKIKAFLREYYTIYFNLRNIFNLMFEINPNFNDDNKTISSYIYKESLDSWENYIFKDTKFFNIAKLKSIYALLNDKINYFASNSIQTNSIKELLFGILTSIENLEKNIDIINFTDSSLNDEDRQKFNFEMTKKSEYSHIKKSYHHWNIFEEINIDLSNYEQEDHINFFHIKNILAEIRNKYDGFLNSSTKFDSDYMKDRLLLWGNIQNENFDFEYSKISHLLFYIETEHDINNVIKNIFQENTIYEKKKAKELKYKNIISNKTNIENIFSGINFSNPDYFLNNKDIFYPENTLDSYNFKFLKKTLPNNTINTSVQVMLSFSDKENTYFFYFYFYKGYPTLELQERLLVDSFDTIVKLYNILSSEYFIRDYKKNKIENLKESFFYEILKEENNSMILEELQNLMQNIKTDKDMFFLEDILFLPVYKNEKKYFSLLLNNENKSKIKNELQEESKDFFEFISNVKIQNSIFEEIVESKFSSYIETFDWVWEKLNLPITGESVFNNLFENFIFKNKGKVISLKEKLFNEKSFIQEPIYDQEVKIVTILAYPLKINYEIDFGILLFFFKEEFVTYQHHQDDVIFHTFKPIQELSLRLIDKFETIVFRDIISKIKALIINQVNEENILNMLNNIFVPTRKITFFPSIICISEPYIMLKSNSDSEKEELYLKLRNNNNEIIIDHTEFENSELNFEKIYNTLLLPEEKNTIKAFRFVLIENCNQEEKFIVIFAFKTYNNFLFDENYTNSIVELIKDEAITSFYERQKLISSKLLELTNLHDMMFGMLEHKINNDITAYSSRLKSSIKEIDRLLKRNKITEEEKEKIVNHLNFVVNRSKERKLFLDSIKLLLLEKNILNSKQKELELYEFIEEEINKTKEIKISSEEDYNQLDWHESRLKTIVKNKTIFKIYLYEYVEQFLAFIIFETLTNAVKHKNKNLENDFVEFGIEIIENNFLQISISNSLTEINKKSLDEIALNEIFEKGKRGEDSQKTTGSGMGLYIIRYIVEDKFDGKTYAEIKDNRIYIYIELSISKLS